MHQQNIHITFLSYTYTFLTYYLLHQYLKNKYFALQIISTSPTPTLYFKAIFLSLGCTTSHFSSPNLAPVVNPISI